MAIRNRTTTLLALATVAMVLAPACPLYAAFLSVDVGRSDAAGPAQSGYEQFEFNNTGPNTISYTRSEATDGDIEVTIAGNTHYRSDDTEGITGGPFVGLNNLLIDSALRNADGTMTLTLGDLQAGDYSITMYHHRGSAFTSNATFDVDLTDSTGTSSIATGLVNTFGTSPTVILTNTFNFTSNGTDDVAIDMTRTGGTQWMVLSGFEVTTVPEPAGITLVTISLLGLIGFRRRRRS